MDPDNPRAPVSVRRSMSLTHVQMWVMSVLAVSTGLHLVVGMIAAAFYVDEARLDSQIGLLVLAGILGVASFMAGAAIHGKSLLSWWVLLGWVPSIAGAYLLF